jgi:N-acetylmuramoyl-L-alanine amidase
LYDSSEVIEAVHKDETQSCGWHVYPPEQIEAALTVAGLLINEYGLKDVVGHEDIAPHRKCDPGPAFPMSSFRSRLMGRTEDQTPMYETTTGLNIHTGPSAQDPPVPGSPLPAKTRVRFISSQSTWWQVDVVSGTGVSENMEGWVNSRYLTRST